MILYLKTGQAIQRSIFFFSWTIFDTFWLNFLRQSLSSAQAILELIVLFQLGDYIYGSPHPTELAHFGVGVCESFQLFLYFTFKQKEILENYILKGPVLYQAQGLKHAIWVFFPKPSVSCDIRPRQFGCFEFDTGPASILPCQLLAGLLTSQLS